MASIQFVAYSRFHVNQSSGAGLRVFHSAPIRTISALTLAEMSSKKLCVTDRRSKQEGLWTSFGWRWINSLTAICISASEGASFSFLKSYLFSFLGEQCSAIKCHGLFQSLITHHLS